MAMNRRTIMSLAGGAIVVGGAGYLGWHSLSPPPAPPPGTPSTRPGAGSSLKLSRDEASEVEHQATRALGDPSAKVVITEYFSLTCTHCAAFAKETMPKIEKDLIQPGKVRFVFHDFPLDQVALTAAMVARYLPPNQVLPVRQRAIGQSGPLGVRAGGEHHRGNLEAGGPRRHEPRHLQ